MFFVDINDEWKGSGDVFDPDLERISINKV